MVAQITCRIMSALVACALVACSPIVAPNPSEQVTTRPTPSKEGNMAPAESEIVTLAQQDLAERLGVAPDQIERQVEVREVRAVTWPDASLGCPQPGMVYAQIAQKGLLIRLSVGGEIYFYHSGVAQEPIFCEEMALTDPNATPKNDEFVPPPDSEID